MLVNPTKTKIKFTVNEKDLKLNKGCTKLISVDESKLIKITSKCYLLRPIIFERSGEFINVYHG